MIFFPLKLNLQSPLILQGLFCVLLWFRSPMRLEFLPMAVIQRTQAAYSHISIVWNLETLEGLQPSCVLTCSSQAGRELFWGDSSSLETDGDIGVCLCSPSMILFTCQSQPAARDPVPSTQSPVMGSIKMCCGLGSQVTRALFALPSQHSSFFPAPQPLLSWDSGAGK